MLLTQFGVTLMRVNGVSMEPTLKGGEVVIVVRPPLHWLLEKLGMARPASADGTVLVLLDPLTAPATGQAAWRLALDRAFSPLLVKRVVARSGETLEYRDGERLLNGSPAPEPWLEAGNRGHFRLAPTRVGVSEVFVLGDDRLPLASRDSRVFGAIELRSMRGLVVAGLRLPLHAGTWHWPVTAVR